MPGLLELSGTALKVLKEVEMMWRKSRSQHMNKMEITAKRY
jgi:hypothetical protein